MLTAARPYYNFDDYLSSSEEEEEEEADDDFDHDDDVPTMALDSQVVDQIQATALARISLHFQHTSNQHQCTNLLKNSLPRLILIASKLYAVQMAS